MNTNRMLWPDAKIFYCRDCKKTFIVTPYDWVKCKLQYEFETNQWLMQGQTVKYLLPAPLFILNGHANWEYREDQNYEHI